MNKPLFVILAILIIPVYHMSYMTFKNIQVENHRPYFGESCVRNDFGFKFWRTLRECEDLQNNRMFIEPNVNSLLIVLSGKTRRASIADRICTKEYGIIWIDEVKKIKITMDANSIYILKGDNLYKYAIIKEGVARNIYDKAIAIERDLNDIFEFVNTKYSDQVTVKENWDSDAGDKVHDTEFSPGSSQKEGVK